MRQGSSFILLQASLIAQLVKNSPAGSIPGLGRFTGERIGYPLQYSWASLVAQLVKNLPIMRETWVRSPLNSMYIFYKDRSKLLNGEGNGIPLQYSCLEIPWMEEPGRLLSMGSLRVGQDWATSLSLFTFMHWLQKEMATHSSVLAWRIPGMGEPGGLPSMGSNRVGHDWSNLAAAVHGRNQGKLTNSTKWPKFSPYILSSVKDK